MLSTTFDAHFNDLKTLLCLPSIWAKQASTSYLVPEQNFFYDPDSSQKFL